MAKEEKPKEVVETPEEETTNEVTPEEVPVEETPQEPVEEPAAEEPEGETPTEEVEAAAEEPKVSRREKLRMVDLLQKYGPPPTAPEETPAQQPANTGMDYSQAIEADPEVIKQLETDRQKYGQAQFEQGNQAALKQVQTMKWETMLHIDAPQVESKYKLLDPKDEVNFNPAIADAVNKMYLGAAGYDEATKTVTNPNVRYAEYVDAFMELVDETANNKAASATKNIAKQAAATGIRPDGSSSKRLNLNQAPENMTDEELQAVINQALK